MKTKKHYPTKFQFKCTLVYWDLRNMEHKYIYMPKDKKKENDPWPNVTICDGEF